MKSNKDKKQTSKETPSLTKQKKSDEVEVLSKQVETLGKKIDNISNMPLVKIYTSFWRWFFYNLNAGIARGLGTVLGATFFLALVLYFISRIALVPIIGDFVTNIIDYVNQYSQIEIKY